MSGEIQFCRTGGCTAKLGPGILDHVLKKIPRSQDDHLLVGYDSADDAAVYRLTDELAIVQTLDFFPPMVEDPYIRPDRGGQRVERHLCHGRRGEDGDEHRVLSGADGSEYSGQDPAGGSRKGGGGRRRAGGRSFHCGCGCEIRAFGHRHHPSGKDSEK